MTAQDESTASTHVWLRRLRFLAAVGLMWAGLHFVVGALMPGGLDRPLVLSLTPYGPLPGFVLIGVLWAGAALTTVIARPAGVRRTLIAIGLALMLWAFEGGQAAGTMGTWLELRLERLGPPSGSPYWPLLGDYVFLAIGVLGAHVIAAMMISGRPIREWNLRLVRDRLGLGVPARERSQGLLAMLISTVVAIVAVYFLTGRTVSETLRGQVFFAVGVGFMGATYVASKSTSAESLMWFWPAPILMGVIGLVVAGLRPGLLLPGPYEQLNIIPAWGPARGLPIETVGAGLVGVLLVLRALVAERPPLGSQVEAPQAAPNTS